jgi:hypothetical protein
MKSEFDKYLNMSYVVLDKDGNGYCRDNGRYLKVTSDPIGDVEDLLDRTEQAATDAIQTGNIDALSKADKIENSTDFICAKLELEFKGRNYKIQ